MKRPPHVEGGLSPSPDLDPSPILDPSDEGGIPDLTMFYEMIEWLPTILRDAPEFVAIVYAFSRELTRLEGRIEQVRAQFFPQKADVLLGVWETMLRTTVAPATLTLDQRRSRAVSLAQRMTATPAAKRWAQMITDVVGDGWSYDRHDPADLSSPPTDTLRVWLPFPVGSEQYEQAKDFVRAITPAHLDIEFNFPGGFVLDDASLDVGALG
jgi:hypothetical protein